MINSEKYDQSEIKTKSTKYFYCNYTKYSRIVDRLRTINMSRTRARTNNETLAEPRIVRVR